MKKEIKEYLTLSICSTGEETEKMLNNYSKNGWRLVCSYHYGNWLIMERDKQVEVCSKCLVFKEAKG